ncbi:MAG TPA: hydroxyacylglutathione hydrolase [Kofleriaceae bacterium]|nr:hydroxyacylglutathione hydrolase [Kofleriaceae bacterium]
MRIAPIPCLEDNYAYLVICEATNQAAVVDPSEAGPVTKAIVREGVELVAIWNTHHHWDHTGGNKDLLEAHSTLEVIGHESDRGRIPGQTTFATHGDTVQVGDEVSARIIFNPGHTTGAISYVIDSRPAVFTGDTLFGAGCGRIFEGTPAMMHESLSELAALPEDTLVYCGPEYTASNLRFAAAAEPDNAAIGARAAAIAERRAAGQPSVPFAMRDELATNPFLRASLPILAAGARAGGEPPKDDTPAEVFAALRRWKDRF